MFDCNYNLTPDSSKKKTTGSAFVNAGLGKSAETMTANGGVAYSTTGNPFLDQFGKCGVYKGIRTYNEVANDMGLLCSIDLKEAVKFTIYLRNVTRLTKLSSGEKTSKVQIGQGLKNESIFRMVYLGVNHPQAFKDNLKIFVAAGSFKDVFRMMEIDVMSNGKDNLMLDWTFMTDFILANIKNEETSELVKKYLPSIKSIKNQTTQHSIAYTFIGKVLASKMFGKKTEGAKGTYRQYAKLKSSGTAHNWQKLISQGKVNEIDFSSIAGRALSLYVKGNFITKNNLVDKYTKWIEAQPVAKFTGYVYELFEDIKPGPGAYYNSHHLPEFKKMTINKQFNLLVEQARTLVNGDNGNGFIVVLDTSSSMGGSVEGTRSTAYSIGLAMALYFSKLIKSERFKDVFIEFNSVAKMHQFIGATPLDQYVNFAGCHYGSTNVNDVAELFGRIKSEGVLESEFPGGIVLVSDGEFNRTGNSSAVSAFKSTLRMKGFSEEFISNFKIVFWDIPNIYNGHVKPSPFQTFKDHENVFYASGFDGSLLSFLLGHNVDPKTGEVKVIKSAEDLYAEAMSQELLSYVVIK